MHYIGYQTHNLLNGRYYIGVHKTANPDDGYLGSGHALQAAVEKHGRRNFKRHDVRYFDTLEAMIEWEAETVTMAVVNDPRSYNLMTGGKYPIRGPEACRNISKAQKGRHFTPEHRAKLAAAKRGKPRTEATKAKISAFQKGRPKSESWKRKVSEIWARKRQAKADGNPTE